MKNEEKVIEKEEIKETKKYFDDIKEDIKLDKISAIDDLNDQEDYLDNVEVINGKLDRLGLQLDIDSLEGLKKEVKVETKEKIKFVKNLEKIMIELEKESAKSKEEMIEEFNKVLPKEMKKFIKATGMSEKEEKKLEKEFKEEFDDRF